MLKINVYSNKILIKIETLLTTVTRSKATFKFSSKTAVNLSYKIYGETHSEEPTILLLHGLLGTKKHWDSIGKTILNVTKRHVVSVDLRNHGDSPHTTSHKYEDLAEDILKLLDRLTVNRVSFVGHSMGGRAAMTVSLLAPEKVAGLLVLDISPISNSKQLTEYLPSVLQAMREVNFKNQVKINTAKQKVKKQLQSIIKDDILMKAVLSNVKMKPDHTIGWACNVDILTKHFKYIASFPVDMKRKMYYGPTLFIGGQLSEFLPPDDLVGIREMFPRAVITYVPQVDHNVHVEDPKTFLELAITFLRTNK
ncbi:protein ABHD11-like [Melitaea cinxia]|uniref:protein ABHD11-like n=1 Tax=Melitaea cinxia TaxID=113334 RepID=UPI001E2724F2|nr:protein ABHD11-like [Melitaea cinxia]